MFELARRRRRSAFVKSLIIFAASSVGFCFVVYFGWGKFKRTMIYADLTREKHAPEAPKDPELLPDGGFHIVEDGYWSLFDMPAAEASPGRVPPRAPGPGPKPADGTGSKPPDGAGQPAKPGEGQPAPAEPAPDAEGLEIHKLEDEGPYTVSGDMGGLIATRVGVWRSPNKLGTGKIAFYCEHFEKARVTHWARNLLGFRVYRVVKEGRAGWVLGNCLLDKDGEPLK